MKNGFDFTKMIDPVFNRNSCRNTTITARELKMMLYKFPPEGDSCKEYVVSLRSFLLAKRSLKFQILNFESAGDISRGKDFDLNIT